MNDNNEFNIVDKGVIDSASIHVSIEECNGDGVTPHRIGLFFNYMLVGVFEKGQLKLINFSDSQAEMYKEAKIKIKKVAEIKSNRAPLFCKKIYQIDVKSEELIFNEIE